MFKAPNIKGPRFRKVHKPVLTTEMYNKFIKAHPQFSLSFIQFRDIIRTHSSKLWNATIDSREGVELPNGGIMHVASTKITKRANYDIKASIAAGHAITHRNYNTDGYVAKIIYSQRKTRVGRSGNIWGFRGIRVFKRALSKAYPLDWKKYRVVEDTAWRGKKVNQAKRKDYMIAQTNEALQTYNEFDLT